MTVCPTEALPWYRVRLSKAEIALLRALIGWNQTKRGPLTYGANPLKGSPLSIRPRRPCVFLLASLVLNDQPLKISLVVGRLSVYA